MSFWEHKKSKNIFSANHAFGYQSDLYVHMLLGRLHSPRAPRGARGDADGRWARPYLRPGGGSNDLLAGCTSNPPNPSNPPNSSSPSNLHFPTTPSPSTSSQSPSHARRAPQACGTPNTVYTYRYICIYIERENRQPGLVGPDS